ncbi:MAG: BrnT family toxin [Tepidisphaeraceae bacterium]
MQTYDLEHSLDEDREIVIGFSFRMRLLMVVIYEHDHDVIRIISARPATRAEGLRYFAES